LVNRRGDDARERAALPNRMQGQISAVLSEVCLWIELKARLDAAEAGYESCDGHSLKRYLATVGGSVKGGAVKVLVKAPGGGCRRLMCLRGFYSSSDGRKLWPGCWSCAWFQVLRQESRTTSQETGLMRLGSARGCQERNP